MGTMYKAELPTELMRQLEALEDNADGIFENMLDAGAEAVVPQVEKDLKRAITGEYATGELERSLSVAKKKFKDGTRARVISFKGVSRLQKAKNGKIYKRKTPARLNEIAAVLEYGKSDQPPRPFMRTAFNAKSDAIAAAMERVFDEETKRSQG